MAAPPSFLPLALEVVQEVDQALVLLDVSLISGLLSAGDRRINDHGHVRNVTKAPRARRQPKVDMADGMFRGEGEQTVRHQACRPIGPGYTMFCEAGQGLRHPAA